MALNRSRLRSELATASYAETKRLLTKISALFAQKSSHVVFEMAGARFRGQDCASVLIDGTTLTDAIQFKRPPTTAVKASKVIQDLTFTADAAGAGGNAITVAYTTGATAGSEVVTVVSNAISVQIATGVSTATQVKAAVDASVAAAALVDTSISGTGSTAQTAPVAPTSLAGGITASTLESYDLADIKIIKRLRNKKWMISIKAGSNPA